MIGEMNQRKKVRRIYVEKREGYDIEAQNLCKDLKNNLRIRGLKKVRIINRYDITDITDEEYNAAKYVIFSEPPVDCLYEEKMVFPAECKVFAVEYLPGQYDQRADSASQCVQFLTFGEAPRCRTARLIALEGNITDEDFQKVKDYCINPVDSREASMDKPETLDVAVEQPRDVSVLEGFRATDRNGLVRLHENLGLAMSVEDLEFCRDYFKEEEQRDPTITEIRLIDTYWSDHCRHTTFRARIKEAKFEDGRYAGIMKEAYGRFILSRNRVRTDESRGDKRIDGSCGSEKSGENCAGNKDGIGNAAGGAGDGGNKDAENGFCLMDIATMAMKEMRKDGKLDDLDVSDEVNACSIIVNADINGQKEEWLVMFKNETHNHPTEIEPYGGAATCLGGAIRDPLSGRSYVYQAMRVTGSGDPRTRVEDTLPGKLPQRKITTGAAAGYSSYGNQVGIATGQVAEIYDEGYVAKRMEIGAVIGAAPRRNVVRMKPEAGDCIILLGGRTGRDGCGGATGSSKEHNEQSLYTCGAEVQKGNPPTERKMQRLFRNETVSRMIKKCNDFGAGGVSVAIGELAEGLDIDLDKVPKKYEGLDGTEIAISESQERMAVVVSKENEERFIRSAGEENLEATTVAVVTDTGRLRMKWRGKTIVNISRKFLDTNGVRQSVGVYVRSPGESYFKKSFAPGGAASTGDIIKKWKDIFCRLETCCQKGLVERFDGTIGAATVLMPFGGKYQLSPAEGMAAKLPVLDGETSTCTMMTFGFNPAISKWSPFHGAIYAIVEAVAKIAAMGGDYRKIRMSLQEYFEKPGKDPARWGKPFGALLGAFYAQVILGIPAIGGKDSMSGSFRDLDVPPTLVAFAVAANDAGRVVSTEFKKTGSHVVLLRLGRDANDLPDFGQLDKNYTRLYELASAEKVLSAHSVRHGGAAEAIGRMCFGNMVGVEIGENVDPWELFRPDYGSVVLEIDGSQDVFRLFDGLEIELIGKTIAEPAVICKGAAIKLEELLEAWMEPLESIFPTKTEINGGNIKTYSYYCETGHGTGEGGNGSGERENRSVAGKYSAGRRQGGADGGLYRKAALRIAKPRIFMPVFPGTNCEYDTARAFHNAGGEVDIFVVKNLLPESINETIQAIRRKIENSQIIMLPGGFSAGDEPEGSGKFIATVFRNPYLKEAVMEFLYGRDGLILGICNGFQALIKLGLLPYGEIREMEQDSPTLTFNSIGRHVSRMVTTRIASVKSPWLSNVKVGDLHTIPVSHGEGRFVAKEDEIAALASNGQIATQYVDFNGVATYDPGYNPNGSMHAIEGITSPDGRIFGKMGHSERKGLHVCKNVPGEKDQLIFEAGVGYFR